MPFVRCPVPTKNRQGTVSFYPNIFWVSGILSRVSPHGPCSPLPHVLSKPPISVPLTVAKAWGYDRGSLRSQPGYLFPSFFIIAHRPKPTPGGSSSEGFRVVQRPG